MKLDDWQRIEKIYCWLGMSASRFSSEIGLKHPENLYRIKRGINGISRSLADSIVTRYPDLNRGWILSGEGVMLNVEQGGSRIPYFDMDISRLAACAALPEASGYLCLPQFPDADFAAMYVGRSMEPMIPSSSMLVVQRVESLEPVFGEVYVVVADCFVQVRIVRRSNDAEQLTLAACNSDLFDDMTVERSRIRTLYHVKGIIYRI